MSLELALQQNTDAIRALTEVLAASKPAAPVVAPIETKVVEPCAGHAAETAKVEESLPTENDLARAVSAFVTSNSKDAAREILRKHGGERISTVPEANRAACIADLGVWA